MKNKRGEYRSIPLTQTVACSKSAASFYGEFLKSHFAVDLTLQYGMRDLCATTPHETSITAHFEATNPE
jgi:hypothetical protein